MTAITRVASVSLSIISTVLTRLVLTVALAVAVTFLFVSGVIAYLVNIIG